MPKNIVWLASYPKSGNTWFRAYLSTLLNGHEVDLNRFTVNQIFSGRHNFEVFTDIDSRYLYDEEIKVLLPEVYKAFSAFSSTAQYVKIHDAFTANSNNQSIIPLEATKCAIYFIRNPLDIVSSFANHKGESPDSIIQRMNDPEACLSFQADNHNTKIQHRQLLLSWSAHVESWTNNAPFPVLVLRYEDMLAEPEHLFTTATKFIGIDADKEKIKRALEATNFNKLQQKEKETGFKEKGSKSGSFFRSGKAGNWKYELTKQQAMSIIEHHGEVMKRYDYPTQIDLLAFTE